MFKIKMAKIVLRVSINLYNLLLKQNGCIHEELHSNLVDLIDNIYFTYYNTYDINETEMVDKIFKYELAILNEYSKVKYLNKNSNNKIYTIKEMKKLCK